MKYSIKTISEKYAEYLSNNNVSITLAGIPKFDISAYNDLGYLSCIKELNLDYDVVDDILIYEDFLKGE